MAKWWIRLGLGLVWCGLICLTGCDLDSSSSDDDDYEDVTVSYTVTVRTSDTFSPIEGAEVVFAVIGYDWSDWEYTTVYTGADGKATLADTAYREIAFHSTVSCSGFSDTEIDTETFDEDATVERFVYLSAVETSAAQTQTQPEDDDSIYVPSSDYDTIQAAVDAAEPGSEIVVAPGDYVETLTFRNKHLILRSEAGPKATSITSPQEDLPAVSISGDAPDIRGFRFRGIVACDDLWTAGQLLTANRIDPTELRCGECDGLDVMAALGDIMPPVAKTLVTASGPPEAVMGTMLGRPWPLSAVRATTAGPTTSGTHTGWLLALGLLAIVGVVVECLRRRRQARLPAP